MTTKKATAKCKHSEKGGRLGQSHLKLGLTFPLKPVEKIADPKSKIQEIIRIAFKDLPARRRKVQISSLYSPLGQQVSLDILEQLPSYFKF